MKRALITGINGMDGSYLADLLLDKGYTVFGMERRSSNKNRVNTLHLEDNPNFHFITGDMTDQNSLLNCLEHSTPDEVYNLAAQSFVGESWNTPEQTSDVNALGPLRLLEAIRQFNTNIRFYQASTSELFGKMVENPANEDTPFYPRSPYGVAKLYGHWITKNYRESYDMYTTSGILFNHEGERRGHEFVTRKITHNVAKIALGMSDKFGLGNTKTSRDWGYAPDYVEAMWLMLQQDNPDDFVIATGQTRTIDEFLDVAFSVIGVDNWFKYVYTDTRYFRPAEVDILRGDASKAKTILGWEPIVSFETWVKRMVLNDIRILDK